MAPYQWIERLLLAGLRFEDLRGRHAPPAPPQLAPLIAAIAPQHEGFDARAMRYGHRYRSAFWMTYLLSALAVLFGVLPLALGWDASAHALHHYAASWALGEIAIIGAVALLYWRGHRQDWQGQWLAARTRAELTWYLPLIAPLADFADTAAQPNWYARVFESEPGLEVTDEVTSVCVANEALARERLALAWRDGAFVQAYGRWAQGLLEDQRAYHRHVAARHHALQRRVHRINNALFSLTALGACAHLIAPSAALTVVTTFFPALGASLHGALAQSESYRLSVTSERVVAELDRLVEALTRCLALPDAAAVAAELRGVVKSAVGLILDEHQDWHMLVRPHHLRLG